MRFRVLLAAVGCGKSGLDAWMLGPGRRLRAPPAGTCRLGKACLRAAEGLLAGGTPCGSYFFGFRSARLVEFESRPRRARPAAVHDEGHQQRRGMQRQSRPGVHGARAGAPAVTSIRNAVNLRAPARPFCGCPSDARTRQIRAAHISAGEPRVAATLRAAVCVFEYRCLLNPDARGVCVAAYHRHHERHIHGRA